MALGHFVAPPVSKPGLPKVYLAGKIYQHCWRNSLVKNFISYGNDDHNPYVPPLTWPVLPGAVMGGRGDYVGPYFISCDHGCAHGNDAHGLTGGCIESADGLSRDKARTEAFRRCRRAIEQADVVLAYINAPDCYGTLVELGWASALNKRIGVCWAEGAESYRDDMWFSAYTGVVSVGDPKALLDQMLPKTHPLIESEAERRFWDAHTRLNIPALLGLVPQHPVGRYRLDFALPGPKVGIEIDGYAYHSDRDAFERDRKRQREIEMLGWRIVRFSGKEALNSPDVCVQDTARAVASFQDR